MAPPLCRLSKETTRARLFILLHVKVSQPTGEFVLVDVLVLWDVSVGAVRPRAARRPPEKALLLVRPGA